MQAPSIPALRWITNHKEAHRDNSQNIRRSLLIFVVGEEMARGYVKSSFWCCKYSISIC